MERINPNINLILGTKILNTINQKKKKYIYIYIYIKPIKKKKKNLKPTELRYTM